MRFASNQGHNMLMCQAVSETTQPSLLTLRCISFVDLQLKGIMAGGGERAL